MSLLVLLTASNEQKLLLSLELSFSGGTWSSLDTTYLCAASGSYSVSGLSWPSDVTLLDNHNTTIAELFAFDPTNTGNQDKAAVRCSGSSNFPTDPPPTGTYTWTIQPNP